MVIRYKTLSLIHFKFIFFILAQVSYAQSRIFLDEQIRFESSNEKTVAIYNLPLLYQLTKTSVSLECFRRTLRRITEKHAILRTCLRFDISSGNLIQYVQTNDIQDWFDFEISIIDNDNDLKMIFNDEITNRKHFDINHGRVFRCHVVRRRSSTIIDEDFLAIDDWIIFNFHHIAFDGESEQIFFDDLQQLYELEQKIQVKDQETTLQYIDCK